MQELKNSIEQSKLDARKVLKRYISKKSTFDKYRGFASRLSEITGIDRANLSRIINGQAPTYEEAMLILACTDEALKQTEKIQAQKKSKKATK